MYDEIIKALHQNGGHIKAIAEGAGVNYQWLLNVKSGRIKNPGAATLSKVQKYMDSPEFKEKTKIKFLENDQ